MKELRGDKANRSSLLWTDITGEITVAGLTYQNTHTHTHTLGCGITAEQVFSEGSEVSFLATDPVIQREAVAARSRERPAFPALGKLKFWGKSCSCCVGGFEPWR